MKIFLPLPMLILNFAFGQNNNASELIGKEWKLFAFVNIESNQYEIIELEQKPTIKFNNDGILGGYSGCNTYGGNYKIGVENTIVVDNENFEMTKMYCVDKKRNETEDKLIEALRKPTKYSIKQDSLNIFYSENKKLIFY